MKRKEFRNILVIDSAEFDVEKWDKRDLFHNYDRMNSYVSINLGSECFEFFARPRTGTKENEIIWQSDLFDVQPVPLSSLSGAEYNKYKAILDEKTEKLKKFIAQTAQKQGDSLTGWAQLLTKAMFYGGDDYVFCANDRITVAAWAMKPGRQHVPNPEGRNANVKNAATSAGQQPNVNSTEEQTATSTPSTPPVVSPENNITPPPVTPTDNTTPSPVMPTKNVTPPPVTPTNNTTLPPVTPTKNTTSPPVMPPVTPTNNTTAPPVTPMVPPLPPVPLRKECKWWKWLLYILAGLLLLALLCVLLRQCSGTAVPTLPPAPGVIPPVDPGDVGYDDDSVSQVITNRLNIFLESEDIEGFARDFKKAYPDDSYRVIYYDTTVRRLQIQVPKDKKNAVRDELPQKLSKYRFVIYDESMFESNYHPNDPAVNDPTKNWCLTAVKAPQAWDVTLGDPNVVVAIIDNGFDLSHPELKARVHLPYNTVTRNRKLFPVGMRGSEHGTHVSGTATGEANNGAGLLGIAPRCKYMPIQVGDRNGLMSTTAIMDAILYAIYNKADVINLSLGIGLNPIQVAVLQRSESLQRMMVENNFLEEERVWNEIYKIAESHNVVIVYAAGNSNLLTAIDPHNRSNYCIHVSAVDTRLNKADFSNWGAQSTVSAPGVNIYSSTPNGGYASLQGTSMAAPIVTGGVALIRSVNKTMSARDISRLLQQTGTPIASTKKIGNLMQLDRALAAVAGTTTPPVDCRNIARQIDSLTRVIERLKQQCPQYAPPDTMKLPGIIKKPETLNGRWKSTTDIHNQQMERVEIYFEFNGRYGTLSFVEANGKTCTATISVNVSGNMLNIVQNDYARCTDGKVYSKYTFEFKADRNGNAVCIATGVDNKLNRVRFNLVKIGN
jgi:subtilisin family serine protease